MWNKNLATHTFHTPPRRKSATIDVNAWIVRPLFLLHHAMCNRNGCSMQFWGEEKRRRRKSWRKSKSKRPTPRRANELVKFPQHPTTTKKKEIVGEGFSPTFRALLLRWRTPDGLLRFSYCCWRGIRGWNTIIHATTYTRRWESYTISTGCEIISTQQRRNWQQSRSFFPR